MVMLWAHMLVNMLPKSSSSLNEDVVDRRTRTSGGHKLRLPNSTQAWNVEPDGSTSQVSSGSTEARNYCPYDPGGSERFLSGSVGESGLHRGDFCRPEDRP